MTDSLDTTTDSELYEKFYEELGKNYPETVLVHQDRGIGSRYQTVISELRPFAEKKLKLLDLGCNDGVYSIPYCIAGGEYVGVDISQSLVAKAVLHSMESRVLERIKFIQGAIDETGLLDIASLESYDVVLLSEVLEHLLYPEVALKNAHSVLKPKGKLLLTTPTPLAEHLVKNRQRYVLTLSLGQKLLERQTIQTKKVENFKSYNISSYDYRHDGYYPRQLRNYVESFGFVCERAYTIQFSNKIARFFSSSKEKAELRCRKIPVVKLFGATNVAIFRRT